ncbi:MAG: family oxidoreductase [Phenylobacterium sp.]|nr:family oxidoreductase [Phenylobacterium sp.]
MAQDLFDLTGKVALVTGGSRGLGRAMVLGFARAGADVVIASRKLDACQAVAAEVEALGRRALPYACHVGRWDELDRLIEAAYQTFGRVDVLVNNAALSPMMPSLEMTDEFFDKIVGVNLKGPFRLSAVIGARMADGDGGAIINISSGASLHPMPRVGPYSATKAGLNALTQVFAQEYGPKVRVNTIVCGSFDTDMHQPGDEEKAIGGRRAIDRVAQPEEIVTTALYLASPATSYTTGAMIRVDGGIP